MKVKNSRDIKELKRFFAKYEGLTKNQIAQIADVTVFTIKDWRRKCGFTKSSNIVSKPKKIEGEVPKNWDSKEWFEKIYSEYGVLAIANFLGFKNWKKVYDYLDKYNIPRISHSERLESKKSPCYSEDWLYFYYADREEYLKWCKKNKLEPDPDGGKALTTGECAKLAGVNEWAVVKWIGVFKMRTRTTAETLLSRKRMWPVPTNEQNRITRDNLFELYRQGKINFTIGNQSFKNGSKVDRKKASSTKYNKVFRGRTKSR